MRRTTLSATVACCTASPTSCDDARVLEISTAVEWVRFVMTYPKARNGLLYPDWRLATGSWDTVHMTLRAVAATQGIWFSEGPQVTAAPYWDVESTFWLRWAFTGAQMVHQVSRPGHR